MNQEHALVGTQSPCWSLSYNLHQKSQELLVQKKVTQAQTISRRSRIYDRLATSDRPHHQHPRRGFLVIISSRCEGLTSAIEDEKGCVTRTSEITIRFFAGSSCIQSSVRFAACAEWLLVPRPWRKSADSGPVSRCDNDFDSATTSSSCSSSSVEGVGESASGTGASSGAPARDGAEVLAISALSDNTNLFEAVIGRGVDEDSPTSSSISSVPSSTASRSRLASTASSRSKCSSTVTPVVPGCTLWNLAEKGTGRIDPGCSELTRRIGGGKSLLLLWLRERLYVESVPGKGSVLIDGCGEVVCELSRI